MSGSYQENILICLLFLFAASLSTAIKAADCYKNVCVDMGDVAGFQLLTVTEVKSGRLLEAFMTEVPTADAARSRSTTNGYWSVSTRESVSANGWSDEWPGKDGVSSQGGNGPSVPPPMTFTQTIQGNDGYWIITTTVVFDADGNVVNVTSTSFFVHNMQE